MTIIMFILLAVIIAVALILRQSPDNIKTEIKKEKKRQEDLFSQYAEANQVIKNEEYLDRMKESYEDTKNKEEK